MAVKKKEAAPMVLDELLSMLTRLKLTAIRDQLDSLLDQRYNAALAALKEAQGINNTDMVQREIARVEDLIRQQEAAQQTSRNQEID